MMAAGCSDHEPELPPVRADLGRLEYRSDTDLSSCADAPQRLLGRVEAVERALGIQGPERIVYVHMSDATKLAVWPCSGPDVSCAAGSTIYATAFANTHEVVHALFSSVGRPNPLLTEGVASTFGFNPVGVPVSPDPWQELVQLPAGSSDWRLYGSGAALVGHLYRHFGASKLVELYRRAGADPDELARLFEELYDVSLDVAWAEAHASPSPYACEGAADNTQFDWIENDTPSVACPGQSDYMRHVFSFDKPTAVAIDSTYWDASVETCSPESAPPFSVLAGRATSTHVLHLARWSSSQYFVNRGGVTEAERAKQSFRAQTGAFIGPYCGDAIAPLRLDEAPPELFVSMLPPDDALLALEWTGTDPLVYTTKAVENAVAEWQLCTDCALTDCAPPIKAKQPLILQPGVNWISVRLAGQHQSTRRGLLGQLQSR
jgi:hypothetical protein